jgi:hypothetical protein
MIDWGARLDELNFFLHAAYKVDDPKAVAILLSALIDCPRTQPVSLILETNWGFPDCRGAWFSFGETWNPQSLGQLRSMRPRNANQAIAAWLNRPAEGSLFIEPDWERLHNWRRISQIPFLLGRSLRLRSVPTPHGATLPVDEQRERQRNDQLRALTADILQDRVGARPINPPSWVEPPNFLYYAELAYRLSGWHQDWGQTASALRTLAVHHAYLYGRRETDEGDWNLLARVAKDMIPPWVQRAVQYLSSTPNHQAETRVLAREMRLDPSHHAECVRLCNRGLFTYNQSAQIWGLAPEHIRGITDVVAGRALQPLGTTAVPLPQVVS